MPDQNRNASSPPQSAGVSAPEGWQLVPKEITSEMMDAWCEAEPSSFEGACNENRERHERLAAKYPDIDVRLSRNGAAPCQTLPVLWRAMLSSSPPPPVQEIGEEYALNIFTEAFDKVYLSSNDDSISSLDLACAAGIRAVLASSPPQSTGEEEIALAIHRSLDVLLHMTEARIAARAVRELLNPSGHGADLTPPSPPAAA